MPGGRAGARGARNCADPECTSLAAGRATWAGLARPCRRSPILKKLYRLTAIALVAALMVGCGATSQGGPGSGAQPGRSETVAASSRATGGSEPAQGSSELTGGAALTATPDPRIHIRCMDGALFVEDVSVPDGADLNPQQPFTKTWRLRNTGSCTWDADYRLVFTGGDQLGGPDSVALALTPPGATLDVSVELVAPPVKGAFAGLFEIRNPAGEMVPVGKLKSIWVRITVGGGPELPPAAATSIAGTPPVPRGGRLGECEYTENADYVQALANLINAARRDAKIRALQLNSQLATAAQDHSRDMACNNFLGHTGSDGSWIGDRLAEAGYSTYNYSEIIAIGRPEDAMDQWRNSPSHWDSVLDASLTEFGVGYVYAADSDYGGYFTVDIARP